MSGAEALIAEALRVHRESIEQEKAEREAQQGGADGGAGPGAAGAGDGTVATVGAGGSKKSGRIIEIPMQDVNPYLVCKLCFGYLIGATTIMECLHTFCKSCIVKHFQSDNKHCPECSVQVHETNPLDMLRQDRTLQSIVFKLVDGLKEAEAKREEEFYAAHGPAGSTSALAVPAAPKKEEERPSKRARKNPVPRAEDRPQIFFVLEMDQDEADTQQVRSLAKPYVRTSADATILHLKKYLAKKLQLPRPDDVDILCRGEVLGKEYSLDFILRTRWRKDEQLVLKYRSQVDFQAP